MGREMKTWRERVMEAKERGFFTREDQETWIDISTCPAGELVRAYPELQEATYSFPYNQALHGMGNEMNRYIYEWGGKYDVDRAWDLLDRMEDKALELKRNLKHGA